MKLSEFTALATKGMCYGQKDMLSELFGAEVVCTALTDHRVSIKYAFCDAGFALSEWHGSAHHCTMNVAPQTEDALISIQLAGQGELTWDGVDNNLLMQPGEFCIYQSDRQTTYTARGEFSRICLRIPATNMDACCPLWRANLSVPFSLEMAGGELFISMLRALLRHGESAQQGCRDQVLHFLTQMLSIAMASDDRLPVKMPERERPRQSKRAVLDYVAENLADPGLSVERVADAVGLSPRYVNRLFASDELHLMQWVWKERLARCYRELQSRSHGRSITSIAYAWGFSDSAHFSRAFRRCFGMPPSRVRNTSNALARG